MKNMWIDWVRSIRRPSPGTGSGVPRSPTVRSCSELATRQRSATTVARLRFSMRTYRLMVVRWLSAGSRLLEGQDVIDAVDLHLRGAAGEAADDGQHGGVGHRATGEVPAAIRCRFLVLV